jgi:hypothetical protein
MEPEIRKFEVRAPDAELSSLKNKLGLAESSKEIP